METTRKVFCGYDCDPNGYFVVLFAGNFASLIKEIVSVEKVSKMNNKDFNRTRPVFIIQVAHMKDQVLRLPIQFPFKPKPVESD